MTIELIKSDPPYFEFKVDVTGKPTIIKTEALFWNDYKNEEDRQDRLNTAIERFSTYKNLEQWLQSFGFQKFMALRVSDDEQDPWVFVKLKDCNVSRQKIHRHSRDESRDYIRKTETDGIYEIRQSQLHQYLTPSMVRQYLP